MGQCPKCGIETEYYYNLPCHACSRNDNLIRQNRSLEIEAEERKELSDLKRKLIDIAIESVENQVLAKKKVLVIFKSPTFSKNEINFLDEIEANNFLHDTYLFYRLGPKPTAESISSLPPRVLSQIDEWITNNCDAPYASKVNKVYKLFKDEQAAIQISNERKRVAEEKEKKILAAAEEKRRIELSEIQRLKNFELIEKNQLEFQRLKIAKILSFISTVIVGFIAILLSLVAPLGAGLLMGIVLPPSLVYLLSQSKIKVKYNDPEFEHLYYNNFNLFISISEKWALKIIEEKNPEWMRSMCLFHYMVFIFIYFPIYFIKISI